MTLGALLALCASCGVASARADAPPPPTSTGAAPNDTTAPRPPARTSAPPSQPASSSTQKAADGSDAKQGTNSPDEFKPSEDISSDEARALPVDI